MMLLTKENRAQLPALYAQDGKGKDAVAYVKLFHPTSRYTLFVTEFDPEDGLLYGWCVSPLGPDCDEFGYSSLEELTALRAGPFKLPLERDLHFRPQTIAEALASAA